MLSTRCVLVISSITVTALCLVSACADESARYQVLSFFFDGVPTPGASLSAESVSAVDSGQQKGPPVPAKLALPRPIVYYHPPYRENRCSACHDLARASLFKTPSEGLCQRCHPDQPGDKQYVHGPVAVNNCLVCHHPHQSKHPGMLLEDRKAICFGCHERGELSGGRHHETGGDRFCLDCHDPHGGGNRFFLK